MKRDRQVFSLLSDVVSYGGYVEDDKREIKELQEMLERIIAQLPERQQLIFRLCRLEVFHIKKLHFN